MRKQRTPALGFFPTLLFVMLSVSWQCSQGQTASGSLRGVVQDTNGRRIAAATIYCPDPIT